MGTSFTFFFVNQKTKLNSNLKRTRTQGTTRVLRSIVYPFSLLVSSKMDQNHDLNARADGIKGPERVPTNGQGKRSKSCSQCEYTTSHAGHLRTHLTTHSGEKPNKCNQCVYASSRAGDLRTHLKSHTGEKLSKCNQCDYACSDQSGLRTHMKRHSGEKSNKCNQCDYASPHAGNLRMHLKTHRGEKCNQ